MSYICAFLHWWPYIASMPHQHTLVCFLCIIYPLFTFRMPNWSYTSLESICIISCLFSLTPLRQISATFLGGRGGWGLFIILNLPMQILWYHNFTPLISVMIVGPFPTSTPIIFHGIHIISPKWSLPHYNMKFKRVDKRLGEVMSPVHAEARTGYLNPNVNVMEHRESAGKYLAQEQY